MGSPIAIVQRTSCSFHVQSTCLFYLLSRSDFLVSVLCDAQLSIGYDTPRRIKLDIHLTSGRMNVPPSVSFGDDLFVPEVRSRHTGAVSLTHTWATCFCRSSAATAPCMQLSRLTVRCVIVWRPRMTHTSNGRWWQLAT